MESLLRGVGQGSPRWVAHGKLHAGRTLAAVRWAAAWWEDRCMLRFVVRLTALLLGIGSALVVVGTFDAVLGWDIFSPELESALYGVFFSCLALTAAGIALSFVLGVQEIAELLRASQAGQSLPPPRSMRRYIGFAVLGVLGLTLLVVTLDRLDCRVQTQRDLFFERLATERIQSRTAKLLSQLPVGVERPKPNAELDQLMTAINAPGWVERATVFLPDPNDPERLWEYEAYWAKSPETRFDRMFPSKKHEHAIQNAFAGDPGALRKFNESSLFSFLYPLKADGSLVAIVWIKANQKESLRE